MSVQTQIDRIAEGVSNAFSAITDKGVTVPDGANVDSLAELIAAIEGSGSDGAESLPDYIAEISTGEYIPTTNISGSACTVEHGLSAKPHLFVCRVANEDLWTASIWTPGSSTLLFAIALTGPQILKDTSGTYTNLNFEGYYNGSSYVKSICTTPTDTVAYLGSSSSVKRYNWAYRWIAVRFTE